MKKTFCKPYFYRTNMTHETIKIDGEVVIVDELPENIQNQVTLYFHIAERLIEAKKQLGMIELARVEATRQISSTYKKYIEETRNTTTPKESKSDDAI